MRVTLVAGVVAACLFSTGPAFAADDFGTWLAGPWGRVDQGWHAYTGVLAKNSCPAAGVSKREAIGILHEGGAMWIERGSGGSISIYDGGPVPRLLIFSRIDGTAAVYREGASEHRFTQVGADRLTEDRLPESASVPGTNYERCEKKR